MYITRMMQLATIDRAAITNKQNAIAPEYVLHDTWFIFMSDNTGRMQTFYNILI